RRPLRPRHSFPTRRSSDLELPHMAALLRDSASAATSTTWPAHTAPGWASMTSASYPGRHGVYQFFDTQHPAYGETLVGTTELGRSSMWEWAADQGWSGAHSHIEERRSEEHTSELQSRFDLVCRLLLGQNSQHRCSR